MRTFTWSRRWIAFLGALALGGVLAGGLIAAQLGPSSDIAELQAAIEKDPLVRVAEIPAGGSAQARGVFLQLTSTGHLCVWDAPSANSRERQGGCNAADEALGQAPLSASLAYDGGPAVEDVRDARIVGLASTEAAEIRVVMSDGTARRIALRNASIGGAKYRVFAYRIRPSDLRKGLGPTAVVAVNDAGEEIGRQATGFVD
jgi:hypothetical protein